MHLIFLDESGQLSQRKLFALGGVALRDRDWHTLRELWLETLAAHAWPADRELKWHGIRTGEVPPKLADAIVRTIAAAPVRCYVTLLDIELGAREAPEFFASAEDVYATGLMFLAERFQFLLQEADDVGMIVVDSRFREEDSRLRRFFADLTKDGPLLTARPDRRGSLPRPEPLLDRAPVRRPRMRDHGRRGVGRRPSPRLPEDAPASLCNASRDRRAGRRRHQAVPRAGAAST